MAKSELEIQINAKDNASSTLKNITGRLTEFGNQTKKLALGCAALGTAIVGMGVMAVKTYASMGSEIYDLSKKTGMGTEALSEFSYMAQQCGTSLGFMEVGVRKMQSLLYDAAGGSDAATASLSALGLTVSQLQGLKPEDQFWLIANALAGVEDQSMQSALAVDIFGRSGTDLLPILAEGTDGIQTMREEAAALGVVFDEEAAAKADELDDALNKIKVSLQGAAVSIGEALMPTLIPLAEKFADIVSKIGDWIRENPELVRAIVAFGAALLVTAATLKIIAVAMAIINALAGPAGWANLAIAAGVGVAAGLGMYFGLGALEEGGGVSAETPTRPPRPSEAPAPNYHWYWDGNAWNQVPNMQHGGIVPGPIGQPVPIIAHGGEQFAGVGNSIGGEVNVYVQGSVVTEHELADRMREIFLLTKDRNTTTGF